MVEGLALNGGEKVCPHAFQSFSWFSESDILEVSTLIASQQLSGFLGQPGSQHLGGDWVQRFEEAWSSRIGAKFGVAFNSWTSGLEAIFAALGLKSNSEVIVPSWTMSATPAAIYHAGLKPVFCDIDEESFNLDETQVESLIGPNTSAICSVDIFGRPSEIHSLRKLADRNGIVLISDSAQCPTGEIDGFHPSRIADIGGFSLNRHKHIQAGEGGLVVTSNTTYLERLRALRNHGESSAPNLEIDGSPLVGHNWRLGEIEALLAFKQLQKIDELVASRVDTARKISKGIRDLTGIVIPEVPKNIKHDYYMLGMLYEWKETGVSRELIAKALRAEGVSFLVDKYSDVHRLPAFSNYSRGNMKVTETYNSEKFLGLYLCGNAFDEDTIVNVIYSFNKVWRHLDQLRKYEKSITV